MTDTIRECLCHTGLPARAHHARPRPPVPEAVTFAQFARAARRYGWSLDFLMRQFRGRIDQPGEFFGRVLDRRDAHGGVVIPYRSVLEWYHREVAYSRTRRRHTAGKNARVSYVSRPKSSAVGTDPQTAPKAHAGRTDYEAPHGDPDTP